MVTAVPIPYTVEEDCQSAIGVFDLNGKKIKTIHDKKLETAGNKTAKWDGKTDLGTRAPNGDYKVIVQKNKLGDHVWTNRIGNTSSSATDGAKRFGCYQHPTDIKIAGSKMYFVCDFNESSTSIFWIDLNNLREVNRLLSYSKQHQIFAKNIAINKVTRRVYIGGYDGWNQITTPDGVIVVDLPTFIVGVDLDTNAELILPGGAPITMKSGHTYASAINIDSSYVNGKAAFITGMAVSENTNFMYLTYSLLNRVRVLSQSTGAIVADLTFTAPTNIEIHGDDVWLNENGTIKKYSIAVDGSLTATGASIGGYVKAIHFNISPDGSTIDVCDKNNGSETYRSYSTTTYSQISTIGGQSYLTDSNVLPDKFYWGRGCSARDSSNNSYIVDGGNCRIQKFNSSGVYAGISDFFAGTIMWEGVNYCVFGDKVDKGRIFSNGKEYYIDYTKVDTPELCWTLVRNHNPAIEAIGGALFVGEQYNTLRSPVTFTAFASDNSQKTFAYLVTDNGNHQVQLVEVPKTGVVRFSPKPLYPKNNNWDLKADGSETKQSRSKPGENAICTSREFLGYWDTDGDPARPATSTTLYNIQKWNAYDPISTAEAETQGQKLNNGKYATFITASTGQPGYHAGLINGTTNEIDAYFSMATTRPYSGDWPNDGWFDIGNGVKNAGVNVIGLGEFVIWAYRGEFWKASQTNFWNWFSKYGLFLFQHGTWGGASTSTGRGTYEMAGNVHTMVVNKIEGDISVSEGKYTFFYNDENYNSAVSMVNFTIHPDDIVYDEIDITLNITDTGLLRGDYAGKYLGNAKLIGFSQVAGINTVSIPAANSASFEGWFKPIYSELYSISVTSNGPVRVFSNNSPINQLTANISDLTNLTTKEYSFNIQVKAGIWYPIRVELFGTTGSLSWSSTSQIKQLIPPSALCPAIAPDYSNGIPLLYNLDHTRNITNMYGVTRFPEIDSSGTYVWTIQSFKKRYKRADSWANFGLNINNTAWDRFDLGDVSENIESWTLKGYLNLEGGSGDASTNTAYFQVLDSADKVILQQNVTTIGSTRYVYLNNVLIGQAEGVIPAELQQWNRVEISANGSVLSVRFDPYGTFDVPTLDGSWSKPKTMRRIFTTTNRRIEREISIDDFLFNTVNGDTPPDPDPDPTPIGDRIIARGVKYMAPTPVTDLGIGDMEIGTTFKVY